MPFIRSLQNNEYTTPERTVLVFGAGRGGTSAVAGVMRELGVEMPNAHPLKHEWSPVGSAAQLDISALKATIAAFDEAHPVWGWKSPKDVFTANELLPTLRNPVVIIVVRNPLDVSESIKRHDDVDIEVGFTETISAYAEIASFMSYAHCPVCLVSFEALRTAPRAVVTALAEWLGIGATAAAIDNAVTFVSGERAYRGLTSAGASKTIDDVEVQGDRARIQMAVYPRFVARLSERSANLQQDVARAQQQIMHLRNELFKKVERHLTSRGIELDRSVLYNAYHLDLGHFARLVGLPAVSTPEAPAIEDWSPDEVPDDLPAGELDEFADLYQSSYRRVRADYQRLAGERLHLQRQMDKLTLMMSMLSPDGDAAQAG